MALITQLKNALEFARFNSPEIRSAFMNAINELAVDMDYVNFEPDGTTEAAFKELSRVLNDYENSDADTSVPAVEEEESDEVDGRPIPETFDANDEIDHVLTHRKTVDDDDDIEIDL